MVNRILPCHCNLRTKLFALIIIVREHLHSIFIPGEVMSMHKKKLIDMHGYLIVSVSVIFLGMHANSRYFLNMHDMLRQKFDPVKLILI